MPMNFNPIGGTGGGPSGAAGGGCGPTGLGGAGGGGGGGFTLKRNKSRPAGSGIGRSSSSTSRCTLRRFSRLRRVRARNPGAACLAETGPVR